MHMSFWGYSFSGSFSPDHAFYCGGSVAGVAAGVGEQAVAALAVGHSQAASGDRVLQLIFFLGVVDYKVVVLVARLFQPAQVDAPALDPLLALDKIRILRNLNASLMTSLIDDLGELRKLPFPKMYAGVTTMVGINASRNSPTDSLSL